MLSSVVSEQSKKKKSTEFSLKKGFTHMFCNSEVPG